MNYRLILPSYIFLLITLLFVPGCNPFCSYTYSYEVINDTEDSIAPLYIDDKNFPALYDSIESWSSAGTISPSECRIPNKIEISWETKGNTYARIIDFRNYLKRNQIKHVDEITYLIKPNGNLVVIIELRGNKNKIYIPEETKREINQKQKKQKLLTAIVEKKEKEAIKILQEGVSVNPESYLDPFPTNLAARYNLKLLLRYLLNNEARIEFGYTSALSTAALYGNEEIVKILVNSGANINYERSSPLNHAIQKNHLIIAKYLIEKGAEPNKEVLAQTPMANAIRSKNTDSVKLLLESGVDPYFIWSSGTYLEFAKSSYGTPEIVSLMENWEPKKK